METETNVPHPTGAVRATGVHFWESVPKNWCFWTVVLEKTLESPLDCKGIKQVNPKGNQLWILIGRTDAEAEAPLLWPPDVKSQLTGKDPDAGEDWGQKKWATEDEVVGWHHWINGHGFEQTLEIVKGGESWCVAVMGSQSWTRLSNWTTTTTKHLLRSPQSSHTVSPSQDTQSRRMLRKTVSEVVKPAVSEGITKLIGERRQASTGDPLDHPVCNWWAGHSAVLDGDRKLGGQEHLWGAGNAASARLSWSERGQGSPGLLTVAAGPRRCSRALCSQNSLALQFSLLPFPGKGSLGGNSPSALVQSRSTRPLQESLEMGRMRKLTTGAKVCSTPIYRHHCSSTQWMLQAVLLRRAITCPYKGLITCLGPGLAVPAPALYSLGAAAPAAGLPGCCNPRSLHTWGSTEPVLCNKRHATTRSLSSMRE